MDLFVRAGHNDTRLVEELVAPAVAGLRLGPQVPMRALVLDATTSVARPAFRETAQAAGLPLLVDPLTHLLQDEQSADHAWAQLPFGHPTRMKATDYAVPGVLNTLVERVVSFQLDQGATVVIPPYFFAKSPTDLWFKVQLAALSRTASYLRAEGIGLPVAPIFAGSLRSFGSQASWGIGVDEYISRLAGLDVRYVALALSASRSKDGDTTDRLASLLATVRHVSSVVPTVAWRQGQYGLAAAAVGAVGYQTGVGVDERCDLPSHARNRRPKNPDKDRTGSGSRRIYLSEFGRTFSAEAAEALLNHRQLRGSLTCTDGATCCPDGATSMTENWRQHGLRSRGRELQQLGDMPNNAWRLNHVARQAERSADTARASNEVLAEAGVIERVPEKSYRSLVEVADAIRALSSQRAG